MKQTRLLSLFGLQAADWNGRQTACSFDKSAGFLYQIEGGKPRMANPARFRCRFLFRMEFGTSTSLRGHLGFAAGAPAEL